MCWAFQLCQCCSTISLLTRRPLSRTSAALAGAPQGFTLFLCQAVFGLQQVCENPGIISTQAPKYSPGEKPWVWDWKAFWDWVGHCGDKSLGLLAALPFCTGTQLTPCCQTHASFTLLGLLYIFYIYILRFYIYRHTTSALVWHFFTLWLISHLMPSAREYKKICFIRHQDLRLNPVSGL